MAIKELLQSAAEFGLNLRDGFVVGRFGLVELRQGAASFSAASISAEFSWRWR